MLAYCAQERHELWDERDDGQTFCLAGPRGDEARALLAPSARLAWTVEGASHFEAITLYYEHMGSDVYASDQAWDKQTYAEHGWE